MKSDARDAVALVEVWAGIKTYIPTKDRKQAAEQFIIMVEDAGIIDLGFVANELYGICDTFDSALRNYCNDNGFTDEFGENEWDE